MNNSFENVSSLWLEHNRFYWKESTYTKYIFITKNISKIFCDCMIEEINSKKIQQTVNNILLCNLMSITTIKTYISVINTLAEKYYDKRIDDNDRTDGISCNLNGTEYYKENSSVKKIWNNNILGFLVANSAGFDNPDLNSGFTIAGRYDGHGFFLRTDNYLQKLPMFATTRYITYNKSWTERSRIMKSGDGSEHFYNDVNNGKLDQFLLKCLLFTCLEMQNHMRTFYGSDGRFYKNNLCFDNTNGETIASKDIKTLRQNSKEKELMNQWDKIFSAAKQTKNYDSKLTYGIYQIYAELNTMHIDEETGQEVADYPELNGHLQTLKKMIKDYYNEDIVPVLFDYEFLK